MFKKAFKMKLIPGMEKEYEKRHDELWQEMKDMIHEHGGSNYSIFWDEKTNILFAYLEIEDDELWKKSDHTEINKKWDRHMAQLVESNPDCSAICSDLKCLFHLE